ncbi:PREDICTED: uncharacterized protein LOC107066599 isoform X2 [Polistes dominula]|uniref:Uncharacterized protein LOC107066599 isoform X2 n=1 Tax=Polistes dominula TaxID=743375 RepID=A0ABM1I9I8_POLDO|nr:PREDICTED: uncharacterized protein LOC107066599 isoform X2 [Polistes dominula]
MDCPPLVNLFNNPKIMWYQTDTTIVIRIMLQDVKDYFLKVEVDHLQFSVVPEKTIHVNLEREIKIILIKAFKWLPWLRLQYHKEKSPYIILDTEHLYETNYSMDENRLIMIDESPKLAESLRKENILPEIVDDDSESSDGWMDDIFL